MGDSSPQLSTPHGVHKPRVLMMGVRRSGKSSIQKVVFHKMSPHETLFIEATNKIVKNDIANSSFVRDCKHGDPAFRLPPLPPPPHPSAEMRVRAAAPSARSSSKSGTSPDMSTLRRLR